jgi:FtsZ-binding cell division protein ZapB
MKNTANCWEMKMIDHIEAAYEQHDRDQMLDYIDTLKERIAGLKAENKRIVSESKQCHQRNDELVSKHLQLKAKHTALVNELKSLRDATYTSAVSLRTQIDRLLDKSTLK